MINPSPDIIIKNVTAVTPFETRPDTTIVIQGGMITHVGGSKAVSKAMTIDAKGLLAMPGFIDLHSDAIEKWIQPRPGGSFDEEMVIVELDKHLASCGVTTIYHCLCFGDNTRENRLRRTEVASGLADKIYGMAGGLSARNRIHARFDILEYHYAEVLEKLIKDGKIDLFSLMDHTPGQGQFTSIEHFTQYYSKAAHLSLSDTKALAERRLQESLTFDDNHVRELTSICNETGVPMASHDDDKPEKVRYVRGLGVEISEFPVKMEAAQEAGKLGMGVLMGAPNILRGRSLTENLSGRDAIAAGYCNIVASDYAPMSLSHTLFALHREMDLPLNEVAKLFSRNPSQAISQSERIGSLQEGLEADLILMDGSGKIPRIIKTFVKGQEVFSACQI